MSEVVLHHVFDGPSDGPVLVLVNSLGTTLQMWDAAMPSLASQFRVLRYDSRGHGLSPVLPGPYELADLGEDLLGLLDDEGIEKAHLCGLSLGGLTVMWAAAEAPERILSLSVLSAPARFPFPERYLERASLVREQGTAAVADGVVSRWLTHPFAAANPDLEAWLRKMVADTPAEGYAASCEAVASADVTPNLPAIESPALCVAAAEDPSVAIADVESLARALPGGRLAIVRNASHLQPVERPTEVGRLIADHVAAVSGPGRTSSTRSAHGPGPS